MACNGIAHIIYIDYKYTFPFS